MARADGWWWWSSNGTDWDPMLVFTDQVGVQWVDLDDYGHKLLDGYPGQWGSPCVRLPTRVRDNDPTADPLYLIQRGDVQLNYDGANACEWDHDDETWLGPDGESLDDEALVAHGWGERVWHVERVAFTREEADAYCAAKSHSGSVWRSYSVPAMGELAEVVRGLTEAPGMADEGEAS